MEKAIDVIFQKLSEIYPDKSFGVKFWDGETKKYGLGKEQFRIIIHSEKSIGKILGGGTLAFGEEYMDGNIDIEGDMQAMAAMGGSWREISGKFPGWVRLAAGLKELLPRTAGADRKNIHHHYDIGDDFYSLWLDPTMTYSCAYFKDVSDGLSAAQENKYDHICRKLMLKAGQTLVDIGCGWGGMMFHAATNYGVKCTGYTLSENQFDYVKRRIKEEGLGDRVEVFFDDYREAKGNYDKFVSIGMFEHVGKKNYPEFFRTMKRILKPGGAGMLHTIGATFEGRNDPWVDKYIFPGGFLPTLALVSGNMAKAGLVLQDVEDLRQHYGMTLDVWAGNFEDNIVAVRKVIVGTRRDEKQADRFIRMWRLYLNASSASFKNGGNRLYQIVFTNGIDNNWPLTRDHIYHF
jgi:cyclopropane-fatty-acyl-phospholipid synthase